MKTSHKKSLCTFALSTLLLAGAGLHIPKALADGTSSAHSISGERGAPATLPGLEIIEALFMRAHTVEVTAHISEMKADGVTSRKYVAAFTVKGALVYDHEFAGKGLFPNGSKAGRNAGLQLFPYEINLGKDGRTYIKTSVVAFKNMNSEIQDNDLDFTVDDGYYGDGEPYGAWKVIDNLDILSWEYHNDIARGIREHNLSLAKLDLKIGLYRNDAGNFFVALKAGADPVRGSFLDIKDFYTGDKEGETLSASGFQTRLFYGAVINYERNGWRFEGGIDLSNTWTWFDQESPERTAANKLGSQAHEDKVEQYANDKLRYEVEHGLSEPLGTQTYYDLTGIKRPGTYDKSEAKTTTRHRFVANPYISVSKRVNSGDSIPTRVGLRVDAQLPIEDALSGEFRRDLNERGNDARLNGTFFVNW